MSGTLNTSETVPNSTTRVHNGPIAPWAHSVASIAGSSISMALFYPLDFIRTRMQSCKSGRLQPLRSTKQILQAEGLKGMYKGITVAMFSYSAAWGIYMLSFRTAQQKLFVLPKEKTEQNFNDIKVIDECAVYVFLSACVAALITGTCLTPLNFLKTRRQLHDGKINDASVGLFESLKSTIKKEGVLSLLRGVGPQILLTGSTTIQITLYEELKRKTFRDGKNPSFVEVAFASALSRAVALTICNPLEVVRTRLQDKRSCFLPEYSSMCRAFGTIWRTEGILGLYRGLPVNIFRVIPTTVTTVFLYEKSLVAMKTFDSVDLFFSRQQFESSCDAESVMSTNAMN